MKEWRQIIMNKDMIFFRNMDILVDKNIVKTIKDYSGQHYYPHTLADYANAITKYIKNEIYICLLWQ